MPCIKILKVNAPSQIIDDIPFKIFFKLIYFSFNPFKLFLSVEDKDTNKVLGEYTKSIKNFWWFGIEEYFVWTKIDSDKNKEKLLISTGYIDKNNNHHKKHHLDIYKEKHGKHHSKGKTK